MLTMDLPKLIAAVGCTQALGEKYGPPLTQAMEKYGIADTAWRAAHFLAQISHECASFYYQEEIADGSRYEGNLRLGNTLPGDGKRLRIASADSSSRRRRSAYE